MIGKVVTVEESTLSLSLPGDMIGKQIKIVTFRVEEEAEAIEELTAELHANESGISIPQWQKDPVLAEKKRMEENPELLLSWESVKSGLKSGKKN